MTSQTAVTIVPAINNLKIPLISPTVSTNELSGLDDYFFRVYYTNAQAAQLLASYLTEQDKPLHIAAIYDLSNRAYTEDWVLYFQEMFEKQAGSKVTRIPFDIRSNTLYIDLATRAIEVNPDGVLLLANAVDTAMVCPVAWLCVDRSRGGARRSRSREGGQKSAMCSGSVFFGGRENIGSTWIQ